MKKTIGLFTNHQNINEYFAKKPEYHQAYGELSEEISRQGGVMYLVGPQNNYMGNGDFSDSKQFVNQKVEDSGAVKIDVLFDKSSFQSDQTIPVFNTAFINEICTDKWMTYQTFPQFCPDTFKISSLEEWRTALPQIETDIIVIKPIDGGEGKGVIVSSKSDVSETSLQFPLLLQEFLDSSQGVPGIVDGIHDFRIAIVNGEIIYCYFRTPPSGSYIANVSQGGRFEVVPVQKIPEDALDVVASIEKFMSQSPNRFYGVDLAFTPKGVKIIEMNSMLGLLPNKDGEEFKKLKQRLASILLSLSK